MLTPATEHQLTPTATAFRIAAMAAIILGSFQFGVFFGGSFARPPSLCGGASSLPAPVSATPLLATGTSPAAIEPGAALVAHGADAATLPEIRVVASLTTIPQRIANIKGLLDSLFAQTYPIDHVELNVPYRCLRTNEEYVIPAWLAAMPRVVIHRTEDYGAMTKVSPTLLRHAANDDGAYIWSVDDDRAYGLETLAGLVKYVPKYPHDIIAYGIQDYTWTQRTAKKEVKDLSRHQSKGKMQGNPPPPTTPHDPPHVDVPIKFQFFEGYKTVLYPPRIIGSDFASYIEKTAASLDCRKSDDIVLSYYFRDRCNFVKAAKGNASNSPLSYGKTAQALHKQDDGHRLRYQRVVAWLQANSSNLSIGLLRS